MGTRLGRDLLDTDCQLKRFAACLLHPDTDTGRLYWNELYSRARGIWGTSRLPFQSFHRVWITADRAEVFVKERNAIFADLRTGTSFDSWGKEKDTTFAVVVDQHLKAECQFDVDAWNHNLNAQQTALPVRAPAELVNKMASQVFTDLMIPIIERELNEGTSFRGSPTDP